MTQKTPLMTRQTSAQCRSTAVSDAAARQRRAILEIVDDLMNTESLLATAIPALDSDGVDPEDVQIALVIVRARLRAARERLDALRD